jgi:hypothetical protein
MSPSAIKGAWSSRPPPLTIASRLFRTITITRRMFHRVKKRTPRAGTGVTESPSTNRRQVRLSACQRLAANFDVFAIRYRSNHRRKR